MIVLKSVVFKMPVRFGMRFEMKRLGEADCFLSLEIKKCDDDIFSLKKDMHQVYCRGFVWRIQEKNYS